jgi:hypothetical protein
MSLFGRAALMGRQPSASQTIPANAVHWWDFSSTANYTTSGSNITGATDLIGSADLTVAGGNVAEVAHASVSGFHGAQADATSHGYFHAATGTLTQPTTFVCVVHQSEAANGPTLLSSGGFAGSQMIFFKSSTGRQFWTHAGTALITTTPSPDFNPDDGGVLWIEFNGASSAVYINNTLVSSGAAGANSNPTPLRLLSNQDDNQPWRGELFEMFVCTGGIESSGSRAAVTADLIAKWSI